MAKLKYINDEVVKLQGYKNGVTNNAASWTGTGITDVTIQADITSLEDADGQIDSLKDQTQQKITQARALVATVKNKNEDFEKQAIGLHVQTPEKLNEYNIVLPAANGVRPLPSKVRIPSITDDDDGEGFKIIIQRDKDADYYEWERGESANPGDVNTIPQMQFLKTTKKITLIDDDIVKGRRYWYRVRAVNNKGAGAWSEAVSRVQ